MVNKPPGLSLSLCCLLASSGPVAWCSGEQQGLTTPTGHLVSCLVLLLVPTYSALAPPQRPALPFTASSSEHLRLDFHLQFNPISLPFTLQHPLLLIIFFFLPFYLFIYLFLAVPSNMWDLSPSTRDQTRAPCIGSTEY